MSSLAHFASFECICYGFKNFSNMFTLLVHDKKTCESACFQ